MAKRQNRKRGARGSKVIYEDEHDEEHDPKPQPPAEEEEVRDPEPELPKQPAKAERARKSDEPSSVSPECPACGGGGRRRRSSRTVRCGTCHTVFREGCEWTGRAAECHASMSGDGSRRSLKACAPPRAVSTDGLAFTARAVLPLIGSRRTPCAWPLP